MTDDPARSVALLIEATLGECIGTRIGTDPDVVIVAADMDGMASVVVRLRDGRAVRVDVEPEL